MPRKNVKKEEKESTQTKSNATSGLVHRDRIRRIDEEGTLHPLQETDLKAAEEPGNGPVMYWMSRDQRAHDNWALLFALELAKQKNTSVSVIFSLLPKFLEATERQFDFMLKGLEEVEGYLREKNIPFHLLMGHPEDTIPKFWEDNQASVLVTDFSPLRTHRGWVTKLRQKLSDDTPIFCVDAHNVVPVWVASDKQEYAARTIRRKIHAKLDEFLEDFPELSGNEGDVKLPTPVDWKAADQSLEIDRSVPPLDWITPGYRGGMDMLREFCEERLQDYDSLRNKPTEKRVLSNLSPFYHFGQIAPQRAVQEVQAVGGKKSSSNWKTSVDAYIEELLVRRELSENYCFYQPHYDSLQGAPGWAQKTLDDHRDDKREHVYSLEQLDQAQTNSEFWNAMQTQLVVEGKLHGVGHVHHSGQRPQLTTGRG